MKIGVNARFLVHPYTGIGQYTRSLFSMLATVDLKNEYFLFTPELAEWDLPDHFHQIRVTEQGFSKSWAKAHWEHTLVPQEMAKWKVDLAHFLYPSNPWRRLPIPTVVTVHDVIPWRLKSYRQHWRSKFYYWVTKQALKKANHLITPSEFSRREIMELFKIPDKDISVVPHGLPLPTPDPPLPDVPLRRDFLLYVGGFDDRKNVPLLIKAYLKYIANQYPVDLILVGGKGQGLEPLITDQFAERVTSAIPVQPKGDLIFTDPLSNNERDALYKQALMLVHPSRYEGFNLPLLEAMAAGCPLVASDIPVNREVTGGTGIFFNPLSADSMGQAITSLITDRPRRVLLGQNGKVKAQEYHWKKSALATLDVYNLFT